MNPQDALVGKAKVGEVWENYTNVSTPATAGTARGHGRSAAKEVIDVAILPPPATEAHRTPSSAYAERMSRVDGCGECVENYETPSSVWATDGGFLANYICQSCGHAWTTSWGDA